jgi:hypothetical protein
VIPFGIGSRAAAALVIVAALAACLQASGAADPPVFDGGRALEHLRAVVAFGPRPPGSAAGSTTCRPEVNAERYSRLSMPTTKQPDRASTSAT